MFYNHNIYIESGKPENKIHISTCKGFFQSSLLIAFVYQLLLIILLKPLFRITKNLLKLKHAQQNCKQVYFFIEKPELIGFLKIIGVEK